MAYIQPNTDIYLLSGINWTNNYEDTVYFSSKATQLNYLKGKVKQTFTAQSYQRHSKNTLRILATADKIFDCNYLMFQNKSYGTKWFYAFITNCEYINDNTTEITYEIDEIQTWLWDLQLGQCFVEREIPKTDNLYENLVPENLETGDYVANAQSSFDLNDTALVISASKILKEGTNEYIYPDYADENYKYGEINDVFCPLAIIRGYLNDSANMQTIYNTIKGYIDDGHSDDIVNIQFVPAFTVRGMKYADNTGTSTHYNKEEFTVRRLERIGGINGYYPKNKKLYTYPYCSLNVSNQQGQVKDYKWEDFDYNIIEQQPQIIFNIYGTFFSNPCVIAVPHGYKKILGDAYDYAVTLTNFPPAPYICDTFKAYLAQNKASIATSILCDVVAGAFGVGTNINSAIGNQAMNNNIPNVNPVSQVSTEMGRNAGIIGAVYRGVMIGANIAGTLGKISDAKNMPNKVANLNQTDAFQLIIKNTEITFTQSTIKPEMAKIIDDYFSAYGYAQHKIKVPNIEPRRYWAYTQTKGCILKGSCPATSKAFISSVFDKGIRFWSSNELNVFGNYELNNSP